MGIPVAAAGTTIGYAVETTANTKPTANYTLLPDVKSISELNSAPGSIDVTVLSETVRKRNIADLPDAFDNLEIGYLFTSAFQDAWDNIITAQATAEAASKSVWFEIKNPTLAKSVFFKGHAAPIGVPAFETGNAVESSAYITVLNEPAWGTKSTTT